MVSAVAVAEDLVCAAGFCVSAVPDRKEHLVLGFGYLDAVGDLPCTVLVEELDVLFKEVFGDLLGRSVPSDESDSMAAQAFNMLLACHVQGSFRLFSFRY